MNGHGVRPYSHIQKEGLRPSHRLGHLHGKCQTCKEKGDDLRLHLPEVAEEQHHRHEPELCDQGPDNPRAPNHNRQVVIDYVLNHPEKFTALADNTDDPELNEWAKKRNGGARFGFMSEVRRKYLRRNSQ